MLQASGNDEDDDVSPNRRHKQDFFRSLLKQPRSKKSEAQLFLENPSDKMESLEHYPTIKKIHM